MSETIIPCDDLIKYVETTLRTNTIPMRPIHCVVYGSRVYGTATSGSDYDIYCIVELSGESNHLPTSIIMDIHNTDSKIDLTIRSIDIFMKDIKSGHPFVYEILFSPQKFKLIRNEEINQYRDSMDVVNSFEIKKQIRHGFSEKASWSEVRARKKLADGEILCAMKSLYHSYRILGFGIQIGTYGKIVDWESGKEYLKELLSLDPRVLDDQYVRMSYKKWVRTGCIECKKDSIQTQFKNILPK
jgi:hypothetical protein